MIQQQHQFNFERNAVCTAIYLYWTSSLCFNKRDESFVKDGYIEQTRDPVVGYNNIVNIVFYCELLYYVFRFIISNKI